VNDTPKPQKPLKGPVMIHLEQSDRPGPDQAPPVPDLDHPIASGKAMQQVAALASARPSRLGRWFWGLVAGLLGIVISVAAWDFVTGLISTIPLLGYAVATLIAVLLLITLGIILRELAGFARLRRVDRLHRAAERAYSEDDLKQARQVVAQLQALYRHRPDTEWGRARLAERQAEQFDASGLLGLAEAEVLAPLDALALREVEAAARQVATVTALVPLALADVVAALTANIGMIRRIAQVYGGRSGTLGSWRLIRAVMTHLVATGAVAVGDDMLGSLAGGGILGKLSRRFGEGVVNGALTARVGVAAMEVCRPMPFVRQKRPSVSVLVKRALTGLFGG